MGFFKAYDMRGTYGVDFDQETVYRVGLALPQIVKGRRWLVGRDCRLSSEDIRDALVAGLAEAGAEVTDLGPCTTSMVYFFTGEDGYDGSVMITASHNPPTDNGLKVSRRGARPVSYASGLSEVEKLVGRAGCGVSARTDGTDFRTGRDSRPGMASAASDFHSRYLAWMKSKVPANLDTLRFAVDCSNGMSSLFARELFPNAVIINDVRDGNFPAHSPNPLKPESREQLAKVVRERGLDCGVIFDGDADRAMFVDEKGAFVQPDYLIPIVAKATVSQGVENRCRCTEEESSIVDLHLKTTPYVLHDIRTSRGAIEALREAGFEPVMVPVGPALAKPMMRERNAPAGGELAGHYYFREFHYCDSGLLAALRVLGEVAAAKAEGVAFSERMRPITGRYANSGELNYRTEDKDGAIARALEAAAAFGSVTARSDIDGIRLEFADGWFNVRKSNTEPFLRLLVEHRSRETMAEWIGILEAAIGKDGR